MMPMYDAAMRSVIAVITYLLVLVPFMAPEVRQMPTPPNGLTLFLLLGQSNMFGTAALDNPSLGTDARIWAYDPTNGWQVALDPLHDWLNPGNMGHGPGMPFARRILTHDYTLKLGLIAAAHPGNISQWQKGAPPYDVSATESNYGRAVRLAREAQTYGTMAGVIYYQGEADASTGRGASWDKDWSQFISDLRQDLKDDDLPVVFAQLATTTCGGPDWEAVKTAQASVSLPNVVMIETDDIVLDYVADCIHHTNAGNHEVGARFADAWWTLVYGALP